ncbi:MAG: HAMP domain-containing sensor histidine kinase [Clostridiaceae bacterium]|nr:HAMP domain-containing sensor histidine kinase [Clostridiaceae bacterium]
MWLSKFKLHSIRNKIMIIIIIAFTIFSVGISTYIYSILNKNLKNKIEIDLDNTVKLYESTLKYNNILDDNIEEVIESTINETRNNFDGFLGFYDEKGAYINSFGEVTLKQGINDLMGKINTEKSIMQFTNYMGMTVTYIYPIYLKGNFSYYLIIQKNYKSDYETISGVVKSIIIGEIMLLIFMYIFLSMMIKKITKPLTKLSLEMKNYGDGKEVKNLIVVNNDEIGEATKSFNTMMSDKRKLERISKDFFNNSTHELKTPITAIYAYLQVLREENENNIDPEFKKRAFDRMSMECIKLKDLVQKLLEISRNGVRKKAPKEKVQLNMLVAELCERVKIRCDKIGKKIILDMDEVSTFTVKDDIEEIIMNLLDNSLKYSCGKEINISLKEVEGKFSFEIENSTLKIPNNIKDQLLEPFVKYNNFEKAKEETITSSGVGLYLCNNLAKSNSLELTYEINESNDKIKFILKN